MHTEVENCPGGLSSDMAQLRLDERLRIISDLSGRIVFTTSLGKEDQVITHAIAAERLPIEIVTLDTGRLFDATLDLILETEKRYNIDIKRFGPDQADCDAYIAHYGLNGFYDSVEARHACCGFRKLKPLAMALNGAAGWISGLRRSQSDNRNDTPFAAWDEARELMKFNPLADWDGEQVDAYLAEYNVPVNPLHARGYPSIGCDPCTRAIKPGEPERAGRWWWENDAKRECGLHVAEDGAVSSLVRPT